MTIPLVGHFAEWLPRNVSGTQTETPRISTTKTEGVREGTGYLNYWVCHGGYRIRVARFHYAGNRFTAWRQRNDQTHSTLERIFRPCSERARDEREAWELGQAWCRLWAEECLTYWAERPPLFRRLAAYWAEHWPHECHLVGDEWPAKQEDYNHWRNTSLDGSSLSPVTTAGLLATAVMEDY